jgi:hypothetical protein
MRRQLQYLLDGVPDLVDHFAVDNATIPNAQNIFRKADGEDGSADFVQWHTGKSKQQQQNAT